MQTLKRFWQTLKRCFRCRRKGDIYYINGAQALPYPLSKEDEAQAMERLLAGDESVRELLVTHNLRLVVYIAKKFENSGVGVEDLISIGTIGLIKAVNTFCPAKNIKLATYASRCIENEILMHLRKISPTRGDISIDEPLNIDWDGNELLLSDILGSDADGVNTGIERDDELDLLRGFADGGPGAPPQSLAAMVAAQKLYPEAVIIAPPYREKKGANDFLDNIANLFNFCQPKDCDLSKVKKMVALDTRQRSRLTHVAEVLNNADLEVHVYDHHPASDDDLPATRAVIREWGSTTTILAHILKEKNIALTKDEATMMGLGLYEDTGSFTFNSTTAEDLLAGAWLRAQHMDLNVVAELVNASMTSLQVSVLNTMLENAVTYEVHGISIVLTEIVLKEYLDDFSVLARQIMNMENAQVILALGQMGDRVQLVARSRVPDKVDVGRICTEMGGGGHTYAAAVSIKDKAIAEIKDELLPMIFSAIDAEINVGAKMTAPAKVVKENNTLAEAEAVMLR